MRRASLALLGVVGIGAAYTRGYLNGVSDYATPVLAHSQDVTLDE